MIFHEKRLPADDSHESNILITSQGVEDKSSINSASLKFLKDLYEIEWWDFLSTEDEFSCYENREVITKPQDWHLCWEYITQVITIYMVN